MNRVLLTAPAKINLSLDVLSKRADGYHDVKMIMQSISLADRVMLTKRDHGLIINANTKNIPLNENNIAAKAWKLMQQHFNLPGGLEIYLEKEIPVEAGLAGGSTDAAAVLKGMNLLYNLGLSDNDLAKLGRDLGADVAFCVMGGTALAEGIGDILTPLPSLPEAWLILVNPGFGVSTGEIYRDLRLQNIGRHPDTNLLLDAIENSNWRQICPHMVNVLEEVTLKKHPEIVAIKDALRKEGLQPLMSGSGPTVFGIADSREEGERALNVLKNKWSTVLLAHTL